PDRRVPCGSRRCARRRGGREPALFGLLRVRSWVKGKLPHRSGRQDRKKNMPKLQPVLLSGGSGTRLWPLSREAYPKQFLALAGDDTMLQATWRRIAALADMAPIVVAGEDHRFLVA